MRSKLPVVALALVSVALIAPIQGPANYRSLSIKLTFASEAPLGPTPIEAYGFDAEANGAAAFSEVRVVRLADEISPRIFLGLVKGDELSEVEIVSTPLLYPPVYGFFPSGPSSKLILREAQVTSLETGEESSAQTEVLGLSFLEIELVNDGLSACWDVDDNIEC